MKSIFKLTTLLSVSASLCISCLSREAIVPETPFHTVKFTTDSPESKTNMAIDGNTATFTWTDGDISRMIVMEDGVRGIIDPEGSRIENGKLVISAKFPGEETDTEKEYTAILNGTIGDQTPREDSYDENADILVARPVRSAGASDIMFQFRRPVAINKMTLCDLPAGKRLNTVTVGSSKSLTGTIDGEDWGQEQGRVITLTVDRDIPLNGEMPLYYTSIPADEAILTVNANVGEDSYRKTFGKGLNTTAGNVKKYSVGGLKKQTHLVLQEGFNAYNATTDEYGCGSKLSTSGNTDGLDYEWTIYGNGQVYVFKHGLRLGTDGAPGSIQNETILKNVPDGSMVSVNVYAARYSSDKGDITLGYNGLTLSKEPANPAVASANDKTYDQEDFTKATTFTFMKEAGVDAFVVGSSSKRILVDRLEVTFDMDEGGSPATAKVTTAAASVTDRNGALLSASYSDVTGTVVETYFLWGTTPASLGGRLDAEDNNGQFSATLDGLYGSTTYYYKACAKVRGTDSHFLETRIFEGEPLSFRTEESPAYSIEGWLEMPAHVNTSAIRSTTTSTLNSLVQKTHKVATQRNYTFLYDPEMYASYWVAYPLAQGHLGNEPRPANFPKDPDVDQEAQTDIKYKAYGVNCPTPNYSNNYYARGHQLPNADRNGNATMQEQAFYATNITPQLQYGFNGDVWEHLEQAVRNAVPTSDTLYIVTGAAFRTVNGNESIKTITNSNDSKVLPVPNYYWKAILKVRRNGDNITDALTIGFWLPHEDLKDKEYVDYTMTVDQLEECTGFDLFANLPDGIESAAESNNDWGKFTNF